MDHKSDREFSPELYPYNYPPQIPEYRQIQKRSRFQRICCPCFRRRRRRRSRPRLQRSFPEPYQPYVIPNEYYHRLNNLKQNGTVPTNLCQKHSMHQPIEKQTQTDLTLQRKSNDGTNETPFLGRRRSSVRFEDETSLIKTPSSSKIQSIPIIKIEQAKEQEEKPASSVLENDNKNNSLQRNVSFRNNEDELWTTITINTEKSAPIQSSHYNRLTLENLSYIDTSITNGNNGVTAIHVNSTPIESVSSEKVEKEISSSFPPPPPPPPPPQSSSKTIRHRPSTHRHKAPPQPPSRSYTTSGEDDTVLRHKKPIEKINPIASDKYNYNDLSKALKSNVERLKNTFINAQEKSPPYDKPNNIRSTLSKNSNTKDYSSDC